jgi:hypothetical protein
LGASSALLKFAPSSFSNGIVSVCFASKAEVPPAAYHVRLLVELGSEIQLFDVNTLAVRAPH